MTLIEETIERVRTENVEHEWLKISTQANVEFLRHFAAHPDGLETAEPPAGSDLLVRQLARQGVPLFEVLRAIQLGSSYWSRVCIEALSDMTDDAGELAAESAALVELANRFFDRMCRRLSANYQEERDQWLRQKESARLDQVLGLVDGSLTDAMAAEHVLGYRLNQPHLALVAWAALGPVGGDALLDVQTAVDVAARAIGSHGRALTIIRDPRTVWAWLPYSDPGYSLTELDKEMRRLSGVRLALGIPASGLAGFVASHRQAIVASEVGRVSRSAAVFPYRQVSSLSFLASQPESSRSWIIQTLGGLIEDTRREEELRRTLTVFIRCHHSATAAARELHCHKNTVLYRVQLIEDLLGRSIDDAPLDISLALHAYQWFGSAFVLDTPAADRRS